MSRHLLTFARAALPRATLALVFARFSPWLFFRVGLSLAALTTAPWWLPLLVH